MAAAVQRIAMDGERQCLTLRQILNVGRRDERL
jgi:hypothetical protein